MLRVLTPEEARRRRESDWSILEPGFLIELARRDEKISSGYALAAERIDLETCRIVELTHANVTKILAGQPTESSSIKPDDVLNVYPTAVTDRMCKSDPSLFSVRHCIVCRDQIFESALAQKRPEHAFFVDEEGSFRHMRCF